MTKKYTIFLLLLLLSQTAWSQQKPLSLNDIQRWRRIEQPRMTTDGAWVAYALTPHTEGNPQVALWNASTGQTRLFVRSTEPRFSADSRFLMFRIRPHLDTLKAQRRKKVKEEDLPKDSLGICDLNTGTVQKYPRMKQFTVPEKWSGWVMWQMEPDKVATPKKDTTAAGRAAAELAKKAKKENKDNGAKFLILNLLTNRKDTFYFTQNIAAAAKKPVVLLNTTGIGETKNLRTAAAQPGVYYLDLSNNALRPLLRQKGKYSQLALSDSGLEAAFLADTDTTKARIRPWQLMVWQNTPDSASAVAAPTKQYNISDNSRPVFSEDGSKLYFGTAPAPVLNDTTLLPEEIVQVEVWSWTQNRLYTEQVNRLEADKKRTYPAIYHLKDKRAIQLGDPELPEWRFQEQREAPMALAFTEEPYTPLNQWEGTAHKDLYAVDVQTGNRRLIIKDLRGNPRLSPGANYVLWWSDPDSCWYAWQGKNAQTLRLTNNQQVPFFNEENDVPDFPNEHGVAGWLENDAALLLYDRYDIWQADPSGLQPIRRLTNGRPNRTTYRYLRLDPDARFIGANEKILLHTFNDATKVEGYAWLDLKTGVLTNWLGGDFAFGRAPIKAKNASKLLFTRENTQVYPDLQYIDLNQTEPKKVSNANPQQSEYLWPTVSKVKWTSLSGKTLEGMLFKPAGFDAAKQYPMLVYFYEKMSDEINTHRAPDFGRSSINFTLYASRGYLVFVPDIPYKTGYPGESAYDAVISGVTMLMNQGFVDPKRIGMQGHSWGGYQSAYLATRTNMFACIESGAPVVNMTSAYGGIRWGSGRSRQFQYERSQSRIGGTLWQYPMRYLENSPLFSLDKVQTPILILHNDKDDAVPWYQGIEFFTALRRLDKKTWLLNYNDEPHWPVKLQNRIDFQTRMLQFFDHYLMNAPQPRWMQRGVPAVEKGILQGLETGKE
jgi:dipeptidyl aminopeptidase/acylaminoacyl peptidase